MTVIVTTTNLSKAIHYVIYVCLGHMSVDNYSRATGYEAAYERYQQFQLETYSSNLAEMTASEHEKLAQSQTRFCGPIPGICQHWSMVERCACVLYFVLRIFHCVSRSDGGEGSAL